MIPKKVKMFSREDWGALPARTEEPLKTPVKMVMMMDTRSEECYSQEECSETIRKLQKRYMEEYNFDDIPWSFLVGGDGNIYEGRGWKIKSIKPDLLDKRQADYDGKSIDIAYIGDYQKKFTKERMQVAFLHIVDDGVDAEYLDQAFRLKRFVKKKSIKGRYKVV